MLFNEPALLDKKIYQLNRYSFIRDDHVRIISYGQFILIQRDEMERYIELNEQEHSLELEIKWVNSYAPQFRKIWEPFIFSCEYCQLVQNKILTHRWVESEKAQHDVGIISEISWVFQYGYLFRNNKNPLKEDAFIAWLKNFS